MTKLLFSVNSVQESLLRAFTYIQNAPEDYKEGIKHIFNHGALTTIFLVIVTGIALKLEQFGTTFSSLNPCPFLPSVATDDRNQFQCLKIFLNNKFAALFLGLILGGGGKDPVMDYHTLSHSTPVYEFGYQNI